MGDKITLRGLFGVISVSAVLMLLFRLAMLRNASNAFIALAVCVSIPIVTLILFSIAFLILLPFGVIADLTRESRMPGTSPFAADRLPEQLIPTKDSEVAR